VNSSTAPLPPEALGQRLADVFAVVGPLYRQAAALVIAHEAVEGVSTGVRAVLEQITRHGPQTVPTIAQALAISRQYVQRMVDDAITAEMVTPRPNPRHKRSCLLALTPVGQHAIDAITRREQTVLAGATGDLTEQDIATSIRVLDSMIAVTRRTPR
jgi:DNA-binding MarR family transcriptional regulator